MKSHDINRIRNERRKRWSKIRGKHTKDILMLQDLDVLTKKPSKKKRKVADKRSFKIFFHDGYCTVLAAHGAVLAADLGVDLPGPVPIYRDLELGLPVTVPSELREELILPPEPVLQGVAYVGRDLEGDDALPDLLDVWQGQVFGRGYVAEIIGTGTSGKGAADATGYVIVAHPDLDR
jgi:hypothetical protein